MNTKILLLTVSKTQCKSQNRSKKEKSKTTVKHIASTLNGQLGTSSISVICAFWAAEKPKK